MFRTAMLFALTFTSSTAMASDLADYLNAQRAAQNTGWQSDPGFGNGDDCNSGSYTRYRDSYTSPPTASPIPQQPSSGGVNQEISPSEGPDELCHLMGPMFSFTCYGGYWAQPLWGILLNNGLTVGNYFDF